jgi:hypothetical protein
MVHVVVLGGWFKLSPAGEEKNIKKGRKKKKKKNGNRRQPSSPIDYPPPAMGLQAPKSVAQTVSTPKNTPIAAAVEGKKKRNSSSPVTACLIVLKGF